MVAKLFSRHGGVIGKTRMAAGQHYCRSSLTLAAPSFQMLSPRGGSCTVLNEFSVLEFKFCGMLTTHGASGVYLLVLSSLH